MSATMTEPTRASSRSSQSSSSQATAVNGVVRLDVDAGERIDTGT